VTASLAEVRRRREERINDPHHHPHPGARISNSR
jgi:hypothetical protein